MVLSRSPYKWVSFSTSKFKTEGSIEGHEQAFAFFEGVPDTVVYDQDRVFLVDENKGDLVLTEKFRAYTRQCGFKFHFCRKADPESKGKIENVVKYVKFDKTNDGKLIKGKQRLNIYKLLQGGIYQNPSIKN